MPRVAENAGTPNADRRDDSLARMNAEFEDNQRGKPLKALIGLGILIVVALVLARVDRDRHVAAPPPSAITDSGGAHGHTVGRAPMRPG
jgi:hypothetical protein